MNITLMKKVSLHTNKWDVAADNNSEMLVREIMCVHFRKRNNILQYLNFYYIQIQL